MEIYCFSQKKYEVMKIVLFILIVLISCNDRGFDERDSTDPTIEPVRDYTKDSLKKDSARFVQIQTPKGEN